MTSSRHSHTDPLAPKVPHIIYGADYNPDQWPDEVWLDDARLMQEAGVNLVSLAIFSWARIEPRPGTYDFDWLDRVMDLLNAHGIKVNLATATASPPPWLAKLHPDSLPVTREGVILWPGGRQAYCPSSPAYREAAARLLRQIAARYKDHPALAMWHINNEYGCHVSQCYCDTSAAAFRIWLQKRYSTIDALNHAWGTAFWSQHYADWDEINPPRSAPTFCNPTQQVDYIRFSSDAILDLFDMEREIIREITPDVPVTTNFMGFFKPLDYWTWATHEDIVSHDSYPDPLDAQSPMLAAATYDLMRSLGRGKPWILMEQTTGQVNWRAQNGLKQPGQMRAWSFSALARGADGIMFFQWRASRAGSEKYHSGMIPHVGTENSRIWREVTQLGSDLSKLDNLRGASGDARVAIIFDWDSWWTMELDSKPSSSVRLLTSVQAYYEYLYAENIAVDFVPPTADLSTYRVVIAPGLHVVADGVADNLERFVSSGGTLVMSFFSGIVDPNDHILLGGYPAPFRQILGIRVEEFDPFSPDMAGEISHLSAKAVYSCSLWTDVIDLEGAKAYMVYASGTHEGRPAITMYSYKKGHSYYVGTQPDAPAMGKLLKRVLSEAGVAAPMDAPPGVEVVRRTKDGQSYLIVINQTNETVKLRHNLSGQDLLTGRPYQATRPTLAPFDVLVLEESV